MEALFKTESYWDYDEIKKINLTLMLRRKLGIAVFIIWACIILYITLICTLFAGWGSVFNIVYFAVITGATVLVIRSRIKKSYETNKRLQRYRSCVSFYEDYLEAVSEAGSIRVKYDEIYKVIETKTNFYIMLGTNQGMNIIKTYCSDELMDFLRKMS